MTEALTPIRVFISSPGDLGPERVIVDAVLDELNRSPVFRDRYKLMAYAWEHGTPPVIGSHAQETVDTYLLHPADADVVICLLWLRMGSPQQRIDPETQRPYQSGTEYEFLTAYRAHRSRGRPLILLYRCTRAPATPLDADHEQQAGRVGAFFDRFGPAGDLQGLYGQFGEPGELRDKLRYDLTLLIHRDFGQAHGAEQSVVTPGSAEQSALTPLMLALPAAPQPERPPEVRDFVGRAAELAAFAKQLAVEHIAEITGMPGVGKTAMAAVLAGHIAQPDNIFWHSFRSGEGIDALIWALAGFLAWRGQPDLWALLQRGLQSKSQPPSDVLFDYLVPMLGGRGFLLCLDDFQYVDDDPQLNQFVELLRPQLRAGALTLLITARRAPAFAALSEVEMLAGLSAADARSLVDARGLSLPAALFDQLYLQTGGNAQLLLLAIDALRATAKPARLIADLIDADDIARYLMREVDSKLSQDERQVMQASAILLDWGGTRGALRAVLGGASIRSTLLALTERYLLIAAEGPGGQEYRPHAMVQAFYYDDLERSERVSLHRRAALFYAAEERDILRAATHFERAGDDGRAVDLVVAEADTLINQGQARPLRQLLERFVARQSEPADPRRLDDDRWLAVAGACGEVYTRLRESGLAREHFQLAFELLNRRSPDSAQASRMVAVCRGMAELLEYEAPREALAWLERGMAAAEAPADRGILLLREGSARMALGEFEVAAESLSQSLRLLPEAAALWRGKAQLNLGVIACIGGDLERGKGYFQQAEALFAQIDDDWDLATVWQNLGRVQAFSGEWASAGQTYRQALELATRMGNGTRQAALEYCLGVLATNGGDWASASARLESCLALARRQSLHEHVVSAQAALADLHMRMGDWAAATSALAEAEQVALTMAANDQLPEIRRLAAQLALGLGELAAAHEQAERALVLAREVGDQLVEGLALRLLAQAHAASGRAAEAQGAFAQSLALLDGLDHYEAARARAAWGASLVAGGDLTRGAELLAAARSSFAQLGALPDLAAAEAALAPIEPDLAG